MKIEFAPMNVPLRRRFQTAAVLQWMFSFLALGLVSSSKSSLSHLVSRPEGGNVAVITVGGAPESLDARPGALTLQVQNRKGFIKLALRHGAQLVPVFSFGENELFDQIKNPSGSNLRTLQNQLQSIMGFAVPLFHARGVFQYSLGLMPYRKSIHTEVGKPISVAQTPCPSSEDIESSSLSDVSQRPVRAEQTRLRLQRRPAPHIQMTSHDTCVTCHHLHMTCQ